MLKAGAAAVLASSVAMTDGPTTLLRRAGAADAEAVADVWLAARRAAVPAIPPPVHTDAEVRAWFREVVLPSESEVWVAEDADGVAALLVLDASWVDQLYVRPGRTGDGLGSRLLELAKARRSSLQLWTFRSNAAARRFYERHGFVAVETGVDNEEGAPDVRYEWPAADVSAAARHGLSSS